MEELFEEKVKLFSDSLLRNQLLVYEKLVGPKSPDHLKGRLEILQAEASRRWGKNERK